MANIASLSAACQFQLQFGKAKNKKCEGFTVSLHLGFNTSQVDLKSAACAMQYTYCKLSTALNLFNLLNFLNYAGRVSSLRQPTGGTRVCSALSFTFSPGVWHRWLCLKMCSTYRFSKSFSSCNSCVAIVTQKNHGIDGIGLLRAYFQRCKLNSKVGALSKSLSLQLAVQGARSAET